jgi:hypothetical protein
MTQDQTRQARDPGYARGEVIADEAEGFPDEQPKPMTRFQKVASALRGDSPERDDPDAAAREQPVQAEPVFDQGAPRPEVAAAQTAPGPDVMCRTRAQPQREPARPPRCPPRWPVRGGRMTWLSRTLR